MPKPTQQKHRVWSRQFHDPSGGQGASAVYSLARVGREIWAGTAAGISVLSRRSWGQKTRKGWPSGKVDFIYPFRQEVLANDGDKLLIYDGGAWAEAEGPPAAVRADVDASGKLWVVATDGLWNYDGSLWYHAKPMGRMRIGFSDFSCLPDGTAVAATDHGLFFLQGKRLYWFHITEKPQGLLSNDTRAAKPDASGNLWVATDRGISLYSGGSGWCSITGKEKLPYEDLKLAAVTPWGEYWFGTDVGLILLKDGRWKYFASRRWLPSDVVTNILPVREGEAWIGTTEGLSHVECSLMTLEEKAGVYEETTAKYHTRLGYVTKRGLSEPGNIASGRVNISDNDGLWTGLYIAAEAFRYAVTKSEEARQRAQVSMRALMRLEEITGIPGFPARAIRTKGEPRFGDGHPEWHPTSDGEWEWKGDTSSDEIDGHYFAATLYLHLVATEKERGPIVDYVRRITDHIVDHGYYLVDYHGEPTTWGVWSPERLNRDDRWRMQRGLNSLEILAYLKTAHHVTGDDRYAYEYQRLAVDEHYAINTVKQRQSILGGQVWHDDRLAYLAYYPLLLYERDRSLRQVYELSIERTWRQIRSQRNSLWNVITSAVTGDAHDIESAVQTLAEYPLDLINWTIKNSHRSDVSLDPNRRNWASEPLPADERTIHEWAANLHELDGGAGGMSALDGTWYLLPYWMGRYHGLFE